jgi:hypothetical protein
MNYDSYLDFVSTFEFIIPFCWQRTNFFLSVTGLCLMTDSAHNVNLMALLVNGIAHCLAINGQSLVLFAMDLIPMLQGAVQFHGINADKHISGSTGFCGHVFSGAYKLKNDPGSGSVKSFEDISVIPEPENS